MDESEQKLLIQAYKKEKNPVKKSRIHAVCTVKLNGLKESDVATLFFCHPDTITQWVRRYDQQGLAGLDDRPLFGSTAKGGSKKDNQNSKWL